MEIFEAVLETDTSALSEFGADYSAALQALAQALLSTDLAAAKSALLKALEIEPDSVPALSKLGDIFVRENDYPHAIDYYRKAAELQPLLPHTFFNLGYIYADTENYSQAKEMYARVVELEPDYLDEALFNLAMVQEELGERRQCLQNLKRALEINPQNVSAAANLKLLSEDKE